MQVFTSNKNVSICHLIIGTCVFLLFASCKQESSTRASRRQAVGVTGNVDNAATQAICTPEGTDSSDPASVTACSNSENEANNAKNPNQNQASKTKKNTASTKPANNAGTGSQQAPNTLTSTPDAKPITCPSGQKLNEENLCIDTPESCFLKQLSLDQTSRSCVECASPKRNDGGICKETAASCSSQNLGLEPSTNRCIDCTTRSRELREGLCVETDASCKKAGKRAIDTTTGTCVETAESCALLSMKLENGSCVATSESCQQDSLQFLGTRCLYTEEYCSAPSRKMGFDAVGRQCTKSLAYCRLVEQKLYFIAGACTDDIATPSKANCEAQNLADSSDLKIYYSQTLNTCLPADKALCHENGYEYNAEKRDCKKCSDYAADFVLNSSENKCQPPNFNATVELYSITLNDTACSTTNNVTITLAANVSFADKIVNFWPTSGGDGGNQTITFNTVVPTAKSIPNGTVTLTGINTSTSNNLALTISAAIGSTVVLQNYKREISSSVLKTARTGNFTDYKGVGLAKGTSSTSSVGQQVGSTVGTTVGTSIRDTFTSIFSLTAPPDPDAVDSSKPHCIATIKARYKLTPVASSSGTSGG